MKMMQKVLTSFQDLVETASIDMHSLIFEEWRSNYRHTILEFKLCCSAILILAFKSFLLYNLTPKATITFANKANDELFLAK